MNIGEAAKASGVSALSASPDEREMIADAALQV